jgi:6-pyruvoyltetrahydropterin/6-carboxytetrahydropterin synthase
MIMELKQHFQIESARFLPNLDKAHPCSRMHGHSFKIILTIKGPVLAPYNWVMDYHEINEVVQPVLKMLDHQVLNDIEGLENPTSEMLAYWIYKKIISRIPLLTSVNVSETPTTECVYTGGH